MTEISRVALFGKLNTASYKAVEGATVLCKLRGNPYVELEHWIAQIVQTENGDWPKILDHFEIDSSSLAKDITASVDRLPRGSDAISDLSDQLLLAAERGWVYATLMFSDPAVRTGHLLFAMLKTKPLRNSLFAISRQFEKIKVDELAEAFHEIVEGSAEAGQSTNDGIDLASGSNIAKQGEHVAPAALGRKEALRRYTTDLTEQARSGSMDPIVGRDEEIRRLIDILMRRRQNNPMLVGEAGVGKTAIVEGFAQRIARGDVPPALKDVSLLALDVGLLQAGATIKGEFEQRLRSVIEEVHSSSRPIILFVDETHTLVGAGGPAGTGDAANLLKPALARGTLRTVGATTWAEYKKHIEKDPALTRRFQTVLVSQPDEQQAILMMRGAASAMERHHKVQILDEALEAAVRLSHRYIPARQLPDKAVSLLDTACARVAVSLHATPAEVDQARRKIDALNTELDIISREKNIGIDVGEREQLARERLATQSDALTSLESRWEEELSLVNELLDLRKQLRIDGNVPGQTSRRPVAMGSPAADDADEANTRLDSPPLSAQARVQSLARLTEVQQALSTLQGDAPLMLPIVDYQAIASVICDWTGIPVGRIARNELDTILHLPELLGKRIVGQDHAMQMIARRIQTSRAGLDNPEKPIGVFLLAGASGVGKTETAIALAEALYGGEQNMIVINMSEYQEAHTVSSLKGAPPGYVGYGEGGVLTEAVRRKPYSVILLDEVEKAHSDVHELFFQVFDKGFMEDGEGRVIDFKNTLILLTTNAGTELIGSMRNTAQPSPADEIALALREPLLRIFPAPLLGRLVSIPYYPLSDEMLGQIVVLQLERVKKRIESRYKIPFQYGDDVVDLVVSRCTESDSGGRMIDAILTNSMLPEVSGEFLRRMMEGLAVKSVRVGVSDAEFAYYFE